LINLYKNSHKPSFKAGDKLEIIHPKRPKLRNCIVVEEEPLIKVIPEEQELGYIYICFVKEVNTIVEIPEHYLCETNI
jgi:hypothetical protein